MKTLTIEYLGEALTYDPETGTLRWRERPASHFPTLRGQRCFNSRFAGTIAGTISATTGYRVLNFNGDMHAAHRLCFALHFGRWPVEHIDHANRDRSDNRIANIRECSRSDNQCNRLGRNKHGLKGIYLHTSGRWRAEITVLGDRTRLGSFSTPDEAHAAYVSAALRLHGSFANTNNEAL